MRLSVCSTPQSDDLSTLQHRVHSSRLSVKSPTIAGWHGRHPSAERRKMNLPRHSRSTHCVRESARGAPCQEAEGARCRLRAGVGIESSHGDRRFYRRRSRGRRRRRYRATGARLCRAERRTRQARATGASRPARPVRTSYSSAPAEAGPASARSGPRNRADAGRPSSSSRARRLPRGRVDAA
jgi:hypothetical protein